MNLSKNRIWSFQDLIFQEESGRDLTAFAADKDDPTTWWTSETWQTQNYAKLTEWSRQWNILLKNARHTIFQEVWKACMH